MASGYPERIVCLTEETTETLYLLGEDWRIVGISGFTVRPPRARREKPKISTFLTGNVEAIEALRPDLVLAFSDLQADLCRQLIARGLEVYVFNHRSVAGILRMIRTVGALVGALGAAEALAARLEDRIVAVVAQAVALPKHPRVYFEEWDEPQITGIRWVSELVTIAGGVDIFEERRDAGLAKDRIVADPLEVPRRAPDLIIGSWCGKAFKPARVAARPGWADVPAVRDGELHEIKSSIILQPGPAALTDGLDALHRVIAAWAARQSASG